MLYTVTIKSEVRSSIIVQTVYAPTVELLESLADELRMDYAHYFGINYNEVDSIINAGIHIDNERAEAFKQMFPQDRVSTLSSTVV